jgi:branched-chain amino acid aminotransferase
MPAYPGTFLKAGVCGTTGLKGIGPAETDLGGMTTAAGRTYWLDGRLLSPEDAHAPLLTHGLHYGTAVFEGIRAYPTPRGTAVFRLDDHLRRFEASAVHYGLKLGFSVDELHEAVLETLRASGLSDAYVRPLAYFGDETIALAPSTRCSTHVLIAVFGFPPLMADSPGARTTISPIQKFSSRALPSTIKASGHYTNSVLALQDAVARGFDEAILLNDRGDVSEGSGENIFIVKGGELHTNDASADILYGITRDSILQIAEVEDIPASIGPISLEALLGADEAFFTGTAAEVIPILAIDSRLMPERRPVTERLRDIYARAVRGEDDRFANWLTLLD